jgi:hypothetical protein
MPIISLSFLGVYGQCLVYLSLISVTVILSLPETKTLGSPDCPLSLLALFCARY